MYLVMFFQRERTLGFFITLHYYILGLSLILIGRLVNLSVQTFQPLISIYRRGIFLCIIIGDIRQFIAHKLCLGSVLLKESNTTCFLRTAKYWSPWSWSLSMTPSTLSLSNNIWVTMFTFLCMVSFLSPIKIINTFCFKLIFSETFLYN